MRRASVDGPGYTIGIDLRRLLALGALAGVLAWCAAAGGLWYWLARDPFNRVGFVDLALPWRWADMRRLRGRSYVDAGREALRQGRVTQGVLDLRRGLRRDPDNAVARLALARVFLRAHYYAGVREVMLPQLEFEAPGEFVRFLVEAAEAADDRSTVLTVCERLLAPPRPGLDRGWLFEKKAAALLALERPAEALAALSEAGAVRSRTWRVLRVQALCDLGRAEEALAELRNSPEGSMPEEGRLQLVALANRRAGKASELLATLTAMQQLRPTEVGPWIDAIGQTRAAGWRDAAWEQMRDALRRFDSDIMAVRRLRVAAVEASAPELVSLCVENARELGRPLALPYFDLALAHLRAGYAAEAERAYEQALREDRRLRDGPRRLRESLDQAMIPPVMRDWLKTLLEAVAHPADERAEALTTVLERGGFPLALYAGSVDVLMTAQQWAAAGAVLRSAAPRFPDSADLARRSARISRALAERSPAPETPLKKKMPVPRPAALSIASATTAEAARQKAKYTGERDYRAIGQAEFFTELDALATRLAWEDAGALIARVRSGRPAWLAQVEGDLAWREIQFALRGGDVARSATLLSLRLKARKTEALRGLALVREVQEQGDEAGARLLAAKLAEAVPEFRLGRALNDALNPPPADAESTAK